ncbi:MAG: 3'-5' exonuclease [Gammaproteobacteria bacterium]|nr:3'-5' exonuclease [Gammaproteobacteria bacterium]
MFYKLHYKFQHWRFHKKAVATPLQALYLQPCIQPSQLFSDTRFLVIDCEMSGLDAEKNQLLSVGWVMIEHGRIVNSSAKHLLTHADRGTGESSKIHGLLDSSLAGANSVAAVLMLLMKQMPGTVLVFHHASLDIRFLQKATIENFRCPLLFSYVDTMAIEKKRMHLQGKTMKLRLAQCRQRYGLPAGSQHNALADAQATAELLLAQASYLGKQKSLSLSDISLRSL